MNSGEPPDEKTTSGIDDGGTDGKNDHKITNGEGLGNHVRLAFNRSND